jgi:hypothetical protein
MDDDDPVEAIVELIRHLQVQRSRVTQFISRFHLNDSVLLLRTNIDQAMWDAAEVHARTSTLFAFSRGYPAHSPIITSTRIHEALLIAGCFSNDDEIDVIVDKWQREFSAREAWKNSARNRRT